MPAARFRYKGKFISAEKAAKLSNLKGPSKYVTRETPKQTQYRYKGRFITPQKAAKLSALPSTKQKVKTEFRQGGERRVRRGYMNKMDALIERAIAKDREKAAARRAAGRTKQEKKIDAIKREEAAIVRDYGRRAARLAEEEDEDIDDALDALGFDGDDFRFYDYEDAAGFAREALDYGDEILDFEMYDLEDEEEYEEA